MHLPVPMARRDTTRGGNQDVIIQYRRRSHPDLQLAGNPLLSRTSTREREQEEETVRDNNGEGFPQFCTSCEKQFQAANTFLYCSEACRLYDQRPDPIRSISYSSTQTPTSPPLTPYTRHFSSLPGPDDGPDIVPRFSPTQSRPRSYFNSDPYPSSYQASSAGYSQSPPQPTYTNSHSSTALASLRELATALPKTSSKHRDPESPPKSNASSISRTGSGVWDYIPFTSSSKTAPTPSATPGNSYNAGYTVSHSYNASHSSYASGSGRSREDLHSYGRSYSTYGNAGGMGMDRPLPPRNGPGGYGHRPKSIDLVTPVVEHMI
ncbi:hypothetical protein HYFRA_00009230 [Hymenoscyphus fraxineus]|uniref:Life-span regulatory factor domain-containing protein n=1 Tax=Hymenoscyphus fraxineus TaxID=746836 RepID=A0A9N9PP08_9HELO|nr:hypothetical protein HYFRA_00009230 [Hymenoscyphus fraxineus]